MTVSIKSNPSRFLTFLLTAAFVVAVGYWLMYFGFEEQRDALSIGVSIDIALLLPIIYFLIIRKSTIPKLTLVPVFILSLLLAYQIVPVEHHNTLSYIEYLLIPVELTVIGLLIYYVIKIGRDLDRSTGSLTSFPEILKMILEKRGFKGIPAHVISSEASLFYYTFAGWVKPAALSQNEFTYDKSSGYKNVFILVLFLLPTETVALHYWISSYNDTMAWVLTAISIYSVFFLLGDRNSIRHRPIAVTEYGLKLQIGIRWNTEIPFTQIEKIEIREGDETSEKFANLTTFGYGNIMLILKEKMTLRGIYGITKKADRIALSIDDKDRFVQLMNQKLAI